MVGYAFIFSFSQRMVFLQNKTYFDNLIEISTKQNCYDVKEKYMSFSLSKKRFLAGACVTLSVLFALLSVLFANLYIARNYTSDFSQTTGAGLSSTRSLPIYSVDMEEKKIAISFDCAWGVDHTDKLLQIMEQNDVRCTFFAVEFWVEKYPQYVEKIINAGHEMGTHSRTHSYMSKLSKKDIIDELTTSSNAIEKITNKKVALFRPPYGDYNNLLIDTAKEMGLYSIQWDVDSLDWKNLTGTEIALRVINGVKNGSIILCHNNGLHTAEALPMIFSTLKNRGFQFVPISELIYKDNFYIDNMGKQHKY